MGGPLFSQCWIYANILAREYLTGHTFISGFYLCTASKSAVLSDITVSGFPGLMFLGDTGAIIGARGWAGITSIRLI